MAELGCQARGVPEIPGGQRVSARPVEEVITGGPPTPSTTSWSAQTQRSTTLVCKPRIRAAAQHPEPRKPHPRAAASSAKCPSPPTAPTAATAPRHPQPGSGVTRPPTPPQANPRRAPPQTVFRHGAAGATATRNSTEAPAALVTGPPPRGGISVG